jgi:Na+/H+ antiporter NhaA
MTIRTNTPNLLDNPPVPVQAKLAAAWTSLMFLSIYIDYFHLYRPGQIDVIRGGNIYKFHITPTLMTIFFVIIGIQALMVMLSMTLPARVNRATNLVVASLYIPVYVFNAAGASSDEAFYYGLTIGVEVLILAFILRSAWTWPRRVASPTATAASVYNEPLQTQHHA